MKTGRLLRISVETTAEAEDAVVQLLEQIYGAPAVSVTDVETGAVTATLYRGWKRSAGRPDRAPLRAGLAALRACGLDPGSSRISMQALPPENWAESWKRHFRPLEISPALVIQPSWSRRRPRAGQQVVVLDPGLSFGTGHHPTTAFCLEEIARAWRIGSARSLLDVGCGSGILAIAAARLGYALVEGFDFDPDAVRVARGNAARNRATVRLCRADVARLPGRTRPRFDLVCANLEDDLLRTQARRLVGQVRPGGLLVLAGILDRQFAGVRAVFEKAGCHLERSRRGGEWRSGAFRRLSQIRSPKSEIRRRTLTAEKAKDAE